MLIPAIIKAVDDYFRVKPKMHTMYPKGIRLATLSV